MTERAPQIVSANHLFRSYLTAADEQRSQHYLNELFVVYIQPRVRKVVKAKLHDIDLATIDDLCAEVSMTLLRQFRGWQNRVQAGELPRELDGYITTVAVNACRLYWRQKHPQRHRLKQGLRQLLKQHPDFDVWEEKDRWLCGYSVWKPSGSASASTVTAIWDEGEIERANVALANSCRTAINSKNYAALLAATFNRAGAPLALETVVKLLTKTLGLQQQQLLSVDDEQDSFESTNFLLTAPAIETRLELREWLQHLWSEVCELPLFQRRALLLNLRASEENQAINLLPLTETASISEIAVVLEYPAAEFAELWNMLPRDDQWIAEHLGITRQQVIKLRRVARERLGRRMQRSEQSVATKS